MVIEHEARFTADLDPSHHSRQSTLVRLTVVLVFLKDHPLQVTHVVGRVLLLGDQVKVGTDDDHGGIWCTSLE